PDDKSVFTVAGVPPPASVGRLASVLDAIDAGCRAGQQPVTCDRGSRHATAGKKLSVALPSRDSTVIALSDIQATADGERVPPSCSSTAKTRIGMFNQTSPAVGCGLEESVALSVDEPKSFTRTVG